MKKFSKIILDGHSLTMEQFQAVVYEHVPVELSPEAIQKMEASRAYVECLLSEQKRVYGITTGFGKLCDIPISKEQADKLQHHLLKSHACGVGDPLPESVVRGMMLLRINALSKGHSGIRPIVVERLITMLNKGIIPVVPSQGSLGASGDLAPLSHMCLPLIGLGEVMMDGKRQPAQHALSRLGISPLQLEAKEGLALINGTQMMASIGAICVQKAENLLQAADIIGAMTLEALEGIPHAFHPLLQEVRGHLGQMRTADNMRRLLVKSERVTAPGEKRVQDPYSLRCIPQVHGASKDAFRYVKQVINTEMNAATDNPLIFPEQEEVISGGNFHGQPIALALDFLSMAVAELANISERRTERLVNPQLSGLPAFLTRHSGLHSGYMILQYVAASLVSENKTLVHPACVDSIPSSGNQEDHVSMGSISARKCLQIIGNTTKALAIEYLCAAQALDLREGTSGMGAQIAHQLIREHIPPLDADRENHQDIEKAAELIDSGQLVEHVRAQLELEI